MADEAVKVEVPETDIAVAVDEINPFQTREIVEEEVKPVPVAEAKKEEPAKVEVAGEKVIEEEAKPKPTKTKKEKEVIAETKEVPVVEQQEYANEFSEKVDKLLRAGKIDEVTDLLNEKRTLSSLDKMSADAQIKLNLQYQHPEYTQEEIQDLFEETYQRPEKPEEPLDTLDEDSVKEWEKYEKKNKSFENKVNREAKEARKFLSAKSSELVLPDITPKAAAEPTPQELETQEKLHQAYLQSIDNGVKEFNGFETVAKVGNLEIPVKYTIDEADKSQLAPDLQNFNVNDYFREQWMDDSGSWRGKEYARDVYKLKNFDKIMQKVATEAANQATAEYIKAQKNIDYSGGRQMESHNAMSYEDQLQAAAFSTR